MQLNVERWLSNWRMKRRGTFSSSPPLWPVLNLEDRDRQPYDRQTVVQQALDAWRLNPLARRIVGLTSQYVVGGGIEIRCEHPATQDFLKRWWEHNLNQGPLRVYEWCDELTRSGEIFFLCSTDSAGMTYLRAVPAAQISAVETAANDLQQEIRFEQALPGYTGEVKSWEAYDPSQDSRDHQGRFKTVMCHFAINRPVGAVRGESDLAPLLKWLSRYAAWLEDRARLNRYRNAFYFVVRSRFVSENERAARQAALNNHPPKPGSILVTDESESWEVIHPRLDSQDAAEDGLALKKMIAAGAGLPLHFLAEPEGSTRTTAEAAGGPTFRHFEQRQLFFCELLRQLAHLAVRRKASYDPSIRADVPIRVQGADLSARDNAALAIATRAASNAFFDLFDRSLITQDELLRLIYRFAGEGGGLTGGGSENRKTVEKKRTKPAIDEKVINPQTGEPRGAAAI